MALRDMKTDDAHKLEMGFWYGITHLLCVADWVSTALVTMCFLLSDEHRPEGNDRFLPDVVPEAIEVVFVWLLVLLPTTLALRSLCFKRFLTNLERRFFALVVAGFSVRIFRLVFCANASEPLDIVLSVIEAALFLVAVLSVRRVYREQGWTWKWDGE